MVPEVRTTIRRTTQRTLLIDGKESKIAKYIHVIGDKGSCELSPDKLDTIQGMEPYRLP